MKGFCRDNLLFSLCGLNCGLCPMHLGGYCPGCGGGDGNQGCTIARCSLKHDRVEYCFQCVEFPCDKYDGIEEYDSFIIHRNQKSDLRKAADIGIDGYNAEQLEKIKILKYLLQNYNDGRRKTFFCAAVNLLDLNVIKDIIRKIDDNEEADNLTIKDKAVYAAGLFQLAAENENIELKLRKKSNK